MLPKAGLGSPAGMPLTLQLTLLSLVPATVAANCCVIVHCELLRPSAATAGRTVTPIVTVTLAEADLVVSARDTAVIMTEGGEGGVAGAVYRPLASIMPSIEAPPGAPATCQTTPVLVLPLTVA